MSREGDRPMMTERQRKFRAQYVARISPWYNGLVHVVNRLKDQKIAGHITMTKGERSALAELATNLL